MCYFKKDKDPVESYNKRDIFEVKKNYPLLKMIT